MEGPKSQNAKGFQNPPQQKKPNRKTKLGRYYIERNHQKNQSTLALLKNTQKLDNPNVTSDTYVILKM